MDRLERQLSESEKHADEHLTQLRTRHEQLKAAATRQEVRAAKQAAFQLRKRQLITARDLRYHESRLHKLRHSKDRRDIEEELARDDEMSEMEKIKVKTTRRFQGRGDKGPFSPNLALSEFRARPSGASRPSSVLGSAPDPAGKAYSTPRAMPPRNLALTCMEYEVEGPRPSGRPKRTWREVREDCQARKLNTEDAVDRCKWRKLIKDVR